MNDAKWRRVAAPRVWVNGECRRNQVIEIQDGKAVRTFPLTEELPMTEWLPGTIEILPDGRVRYTELDKNHSLYIL